LVLTRAGGFGGGTFVAAVARGGAGVLARVRLGGARVPSPMPPTPSAAGDAGCVLTAGVRRRGTTGAGALASAAGSAAGLRRRGGGFGGTGSSMRRV
jgi:hypothetical protein